MQTLFFVLEKHDKTESWYVIHFCELGTIGKGAETDRQKKTDRDKQKIKRMLNCISITCIFIYSNTNKDKELDAWYF